MVGLNRVANAASLGAGLGTLNLAGANNAVDTSTNGSNDQSRQNVDKSFTAMLDAGTYNGTSWSYHAGQTGSVIPYLAFANGAGGYEIVSVGAQIDIDGSGLNVDVTLAFDGNDFTLPTSTEIFAAIANPPGIGSQNPIRTNLSSGGRMDHNNNGQGEIVLPVVGGTVDGFGHANLSRSYAFSIEVEVVEREVQVSPDIFSTLANQGARVGTLTTPKGDPGDNFTYALIRGVGATDNRKFQIVGNELLIGLHNFRGIIDGTEFSVRVQSTGSPSGLQEEARLTLTAVAPFRITAFNNDLDQRKVSLSWNSREGNSYRVLGSMSLLLPFIELVDSISSGGLVTSTVVDLSVFFPLELPDQLYFQIKEAE